MLNGYSVCTLCARECRVDRTQAQRGYCGVGAEVRVARAALHMWEEPPISAVRGSGTIFFVGCSLGCVFCQNREISRIKNTEVGIPVTVEELCRMMLRLEGEGAHNINLVTPTHYVPSIISAVASARGAGLTVPVVYNSGGYDSVQTVRALCDTVDIYLMDYKFHREKTAREYAAAPDYPAVARSAIAEAFVQCPHPVFDADGVMRRGVIVRLLLLPGHLAEAKLALKYLYETYGDNIYISIMNQYTPMSGMKPPLDRRVSASEYAELCDYAVKKGIRNAFIQEGGTADESFIPPFDLK